jgi:FtsZ-interacting cell division protein ZipA
MENRILILVIAVAVAFVIVAAILIVRQRRSKHLKQQFGPEYDRTVAEHGDSRRAEAVLINREKRVEKFALKPLSPSDRERYSEDWAAIQRRFVDDPSNAVNQADSLVNTVMFARGYPLGEAEERASDISVNYPSLVQNYRSARIVMKNHSQSQASTEDLRLAMVNFRSLFDELLESPTHQRIAS